MFIFARTSPLAMNVICFIFSTKTTQAADSGETVLSGTRFLTLNNGERDGSRLLHRTPRSVNEDNLSDTEVQQIVDGHNAYRRGEGASNMEYMLVWAKSHEVGCGITRCANFTKGNAIRHNITYFGCNYVPRGNYNGVAPYKKGPACSNCTSGERWCKTGLCYNKCPGTDPACDPTTTNSTTSTTFTPCASPSEPVTSTVTSEATKLPVTSVSGSVGCLSSLCQHGSTLVLKGTQCICDCSENYRGENCQFSRLEDRFGAVFNFVGDINRWDVAWQALLAQIPTSVNQYCRDNPGLCCEKEASIGSGMFINASHLRVGSGYPYALPDGGERFTVSILALYNPQNTFCRYNTDYIKTDVYVSGETLYNGIMYQKNLLSDVLASCCNFALVTAGPGPFPVTNLSDGWLPWKSALVGLSAVGAVVALLVLLFRFRHTLNLNRETLWKNRRHDNNLYNVDDIQEMKDTKQTYGQIKYAEKQEGEHTYEESQDAENRKVGI
ncbi:uncharacterized protein LOC135465674 isoform X2 [Liolophura sinensis]|uniref:uncharacterized protein LOC135465674 isoform X2 n=1 Tax=Liolophura sinensis TaxID=3198878 RepID=UPI003158A0BF